MSTILTDNDWIVFKKCSILFCVHQPPQRILHEAHGLMIHGAQVFLDKQKKANGLKKGSRKEGMERMQLAV